MKKQKLYVVNLVTDLYFYEDEYEMFCADSIEAVEREIQKTLGEHLIAYEIRKATWAERRRMKKAHYNPCIA